VLDPWLETARSIFPSPLKSAVAMASGPTRRSEAPAPLAEEHLHLAEGAVRDDQVGPSVSVDVRADDLMVASQRKVVAVAQLHLDRRLEGAVTPAVQQGKAAAGDVAHGEVRDRIPVEVRRGDS
jgi:hypothetical protein